MARTASLSDLCFLAAGKQICGSTTVRRRKSHDESPHSEPLLQEIRAGEGGLLEGRGRREKGQGRRGREKMERGATKLKPLARR